MQVRAVDLIAKKRDGGTLTGDEWAWIVAEYLRGLEGAPSAASEAQIAALLMAGVLNGFTDDEAVALTEVLLRSGEVLDLSGLDGPSVDKHSTGGVGDGTTLLVAPLLAAAGVIVVKLSGRGLGHTGGTLDKLESIPGFRTQLEPDELMAIARKAGAVVAAQSERLVPADRALYALRDVTGTVASPALIAASVMSKKLAAGSQTIVLDVKVGDGAFMKTEPEAQHLAALCVRIGQASGRTCAALVTAMDEPLGRGIGNSLEVAECIKLLSAGPRGRLADLALELAATALSLSTRREHLEATALLRGIWESGAALERLRRMISAQGGDPAVCDRPEQILPQAPFSREVQSARAGVIQAVPAMGIGLVAASLGAGRARKDDPVDPAVGIELLAEAGQRVTAGEPLARVHARTQEDADAAASRVLQLVVVANADVAVRPTVLDRVLPGHHDLLE